MFLFLHSLFIQSSNWPGKFLSRLNTLATVDIQPSIKVLFVFTFFCWVEKVFKLSAVSLNDRSSSLVMSSIKAPGSLLCGWYSFFKWKINSLTLTSVASCFYNSLTTKSCLLLLPHPFLFTFFLYKTKCSHYLL